MSEVWCRPHGSALVAVREDLPHAGVLERRDDAPPRTADAVRIPIPHLRRVFASRRATTYPTLELLMEGRAMPGEAIEVLKGTLDMMVLKILVEKPQHGYGITRRLQALTEDALQVDEGSMYPALYRMQKRGLIEADWFLTDNGRRAKIYSLTRLGRDELAKEAAYWEQFSQAVSRVMSPGSEAVP